MVDSKKCPECGRYVPETVDVCSPALCGYRFDADDGEDDGDG